MLILLKKMFKVSLKFCEQNKRIFNVGAVVAD